MNKLRVLNLYAGIGGNRRLWEDVNVTAIENNKDIAKIYKYFFQNDEVIVTDAHEYLLNHFNEYDFIWTSPPCQTHSSFRQNIGVRYRGVAPIYPDMRLYQEIIFLQYNMKSRFIVENVNPYYIPLIKPTIKLGRHLFWSNFKINNKQFDGVKIRTSQIKELQNYHDFDLTDFKLKDKRQVLRNCVDANIGKYILDIVKDSYREGEIRNE